jgi:twitching motility protein PilT
MEISQILQMCVERGGSDIHLTVGKPALLRIDGRLDPIGTAPLTASQTEQLMKAIASEEHQQKVSEMGGVDFGFSFGKVARFRVSVYKQKGRFALALRLIPNKILGFEDLGLPEKIKELCQRPRGLVLVTGPTGSGKTTTLATMIDYINRNKDCHIITVEDPIEYYHEHKKSIVTQREIGVDVPNFNEAIIKGLRQDPDVILVGEMRDLATIEAAVRAAETGHLVFATLHTTGAAKTIDRIIDAFPTNQQGQVRIQLSTALEAVISQTLIVKATGRGRVAAFEIMVATPAIQNLIRENKTFRITSDIQTGAKYGMRTLDSHLIELYGKQLITFEDVVNRSYNPDAVVLQLKGAKKI